MGSTYNFTKACETRILWLTAEKNQITKDRGARAKGMAKTAPVKAAVPKARAKVAERKEKAKVAERKARAKAAIPKVASATATSRHLLGKRRQSRTGQCINSSLGVTRVSLTHNNSNVNLHQCRNGHTAHTLR